MNYPYLDQNLNLTRCKIQVNGVGIVRVMPDMAVVNLGVVTENVSLETAQGENASKSNAVISALYEMGIPRKQIRTSSYTIEPVYDYTDGKQVFKGYRVSNILSVTITEIGQVGKIIDSAAAAGANRIDNISFTVSDPSVYYDKALKLAIKDAVRKSTAIANTINMEINEIPCKIIEEGYAVPLSETSAFKTSSQSTPIMPGQINITARIEAVFKYR